MGEAISGKFGLITADEVLYSVLLSKVFNATNNILYINNNTYFWTMTPSAWLGAALGTPKLSAQIINFYNNKNYMMKVSMSETRAVARAVINLKLDVLVASGNGTEAIPYVIQ